MKIAISNDHRGYELKRKLMKYLKKKNIEVIDIGAGSTMSVDYPEFGRRAGHAVVQGEADLGIVICGTGIGISIACNKVKGARCAKVDSVKEAVLTRKDNDANVLALNGTMALYKAKDIVDAFIKTEYVEVERFSRRIEQLEDFDG